MVRALVGGQSTDEEDGGNLLFGGIVRKGDDRVGALRSEAYVAEAASCQGGPRRLGDGEHCEPAIAA
jgi:hypothetical protein